jgi:hypothetical protein
MPVIGSGTVSILSVANEFGGTVPHSMSEYYRGGGRVPNSSINNAVPVSGPISLSNFYGSRQTTSGVLDYTSPGTYYLTVPSYINLQIQVWGAGGGGGGSWYDAGFGGSQGGTGGDSYVTVPGYGTMYGFGGGGGPTWLAGSPTVGSASGGNANNLAGSGSTGGAGGVYGASFGATGGNGGYALSNFVSSGAPPIDSTLTIVVGTGGAGGFGQVNGAAGTNGRVYIAWS